MKELTALANANPVPLLRLFAQSHPDEMRQQIAHRPADSPSFLLSLLNTNSYSGTQQEIFDFCMEHGEDLTQPSAHYKVLLWDASVVKDKNCDYLQAWKYAKDSVLAQMTLKVGRDFILQLESQGVGLLQKAYQSHSPHTIAALDSLGVGERTELYKKDEILTLAKTSPALLEVYWQCQARKKTNAPSQEDIFRSTQAYLERQLSEVHTASGTSQNHRVNPLCEYLRREIPKWPRDKQEMLVAQTVSCINVVFFATAVEAVKIQASAQSRLGTSKIDSVSGIAGGFSLSKGATSSPAAKNMVPTLASAKDYEALYTPAWKHLDQATSYKFAHYFLDRKEPLDSVHEGTVYLEKLVNLLKSIGFNSSDDRSYRGRNHQAMVRALSQKLPQIYDQDFWLSTNPQGQPWLHTACQSSHMMSMFGNNWLNLDPVHMNFYNTPGDTATLYPLARFTPQLPERPAHLSKTQMHEHFLSHTWLHKDKKGVTCLEHLCKNFIYVFSKPQFDHTFSKMLSRYNELFDFKVQRDLFQGLFAAREFKSETFKAVFQSIVADPRMDWEQFALREKNKLSDHDKEKLTQHHPSFWAEIHKTRMENILPEQGDTTLAQRARAKL